MIDAHCHLQMFSGWKRKKILQGALENKVTTIICASYSLESSIKAVKIANSNPGVYVCVGLGYRYPRVSLEKAKEILMSLVQSNKVVGIGEAGLNYYGGISNKLIAKQKDLFRFHLELASKCDLPIVVHNRNADADVLRIIAEVAFDKKVVMHCFLGSLSLASTCVQSGWYLSFSGSLTFKQNEVLGNELIRSIPDNNILIETDSPYLSPEPLRGKINIPENVTIVAKFIANSRGCSLDKFDQMVTANIKEAFVGVI